MFSPILHMLQIDTMLEMKHIGIRLPSERTIISGSSWPLSINRFQEPAAQQVQPDSTHTLHQLEFNQ